MRHRDLRLPCETAVTLLHDGRGRPGRLVNVSAGGGRVEVAAPLPRGAEVTLCYLVLRASARVAWSRDGMAGLRFAQALPPADLAALRRQGGRGPSRWASSTHHGFREL